MAVRAARNLVFGAIAVALIVLYAALAAQLWPAVAPAVSEPTPTPTRPVEPVAAPRVPGSIAFVLRGDVYLLKDGRYSPLTSEGRNSQPTLSADGASIIFARTESLDGRRAVDGQVVPARLSFSSIVRKSASGGSEEILLSGLRQRAQNGFHLVSWYLGPALAPDGRRLAIIEDDGDGAADLALFDVSPPPPGVSRGGGQATPRRATALSQGAELADPAWSPDGRTIAVTTYNTDTPGILLWAVDRPGTATRLRLPEGEAYRPSYSPDGKWLIYTLRSQGRNDLHAFELGTQRDVALTSDGRSWNGVFSPDGKWVTFLRERSGSVDLYAMELGDALGGGVAREPIKLTQGEGIDGASRPAWGP